MQSSSSFLIAPSLPNPLAHTMPLKYPDSSAYKSQISAARVLSIKTEKPQVTKIPKGRMLGALVYCLEDFEELLQSVCKALTKISKGRILGTLKYWLEDYKVLLSFVEKI